MRVSAGWKLENCLQPLTFHSGVGGVTFITNKIWEPLDVALPVWLTHPGNISNSFFYYCQLNLNLLIFLCRKMSNASWRVGFSIGFFTRRTYILYVEEGRDGMGWDISLLLCSLKENLKNYSQLISNFLKLKKARPLARTYCPSLQEWRLGSHTCWLSGFITFQKYMKDTWTAYFKKTERWAGEGRILRGQTPRSYF